ncbi:MAG TPA: MFS transporter [Candidatus Solibacter sp.]|nr:MFS transporter [Candidatus Solibacter sp.]
MSTAAKQAPPATQTAFGILAAISVCHFLNDTLQAIIPAVYPILKDAYHLDFGQIGLITMTVNFTASLLQPLVGWFTDARPTAYSLPVGMTLTLFGTLMLAAAPSYAMVLAAVALVGVGSAVFHPESSRVARLASGGRHGFAQSLFSVGGNAGQSAGPLLAAWFVLPNGQKSIAWFSGIALLAIAILARVSGWYKPRQGPRVALRGTVGGIASPVSRAQLRRALAVLVVLLFSKYVYIVSIVTYYTFYLMHRFKLDVQSAQLHLFVFMAAVTLGSFVGGPVGDRIGRKYVIWGSILGVLPFTLVLPYASLFWTGVLTVFIGLILSSAFSAILVYAQDLMPGRVGAVSGIFFGLAFGIGGIAAAGLGELADARGIEFVYRVCAFLPALGIFTALLPNVEQRH